MGFSKKPMLLVRADRFRKEIIITVSYVREYRTKWNCAKILTLCLTVVFDKKWWNMYNEKGEARKERGSIWSYLKAEASWQNIARVLLPTQGRRHRRLDKERGIVLQAQSGMERKGYRRWFQGLNRLNAQ